MACAARTCCVITRVQVVNLVSNDVRRFDDAGPFWVRICPYLGVMVCSPCNSCVLKAQQQSGKCNLAVQKLLMQLQAFLFWSPVELCCVVLMVSLELGAAPAFAGIAALLALIPVQVSGCPDVPLSYPCHAQLSCPALPDWGETETCRASQPLAASTYPATFLELHTEMFPAAGAGDAVARHRAAAGGHCAVH